MYKTLFDFLFFYKCRMKVGENISVSEEINGVSLSLNIYRRENLNLSENFDFPLNTVDGSMEVIICETLSVQKDVVLTPRFRTKGFCIYCRELNNLGKISMTARGAKAAGNNIYLINNIYVPSSGAAANQNGVGRQTGGGSDGKVEYSLGGRGGYGVAGTSYSGGSGGGSTTRGSAGSAQAGGGAGGSASIWGNWGSGGGAGNPGGWGSAYGQSGTGGLLIIFACEIENLGMLESRGSQGGLSYTDGGCSGGGSINVFYNKLLNRSFIPDVSSPAGYNGWGHTQTPGGTGTYNLDILEAPLQKQIYLIKDADEVLISG